MYFIGNFVHATHQEEVQEEDRRNGEFTMIIDAESPYAAIRKFRERITAYRQTTDFFQGDCAVFLIHLFEFDMFPVEEAMMLNFKSVAGDPLMPFIRCTMPTETAGTCRIFDWKNNAPEIDGRQEKLFLQFEGKRAEAIQAPEADIQPYK